MAKEVTLYRVVRDEDGEACMLERRWWETARGFRSTADVRRPHCMLRKGFSGHAGVNSANERWYTSKALALGKALESGYRERQRAQQRVDAAEEWIGLVSGLTLEPEVTS